jgi:hypothetical protein
MSEYLYKFQENETEEELIYRIYSDRERGINDYPNKQIGEILNNLTMQDFDESRYRKQYQSFKQMFESPLKLKLLGIAEDVYLAQLEEKRLDLEKSKVKARDIKRALNTDIRKLARIEELLDAIEQSANQFPNLEKPYIGSVQGGATAVLLISDWHIGNIIDNFVNKFNLDVAIKRIGVLRDEVIKYCKINKVNTLHVLGLGDFIHGNIHVNGRVLSDMDAVQQTQKAAELIYELLMSLSEHIHHVDYRQCLDNHSRINKDYSEHVESESFANFISWWLTARLRGSRVDFVNDNIDENIGSINVKGDQYLFVHGHLEKPNSILQDLVFGTGIMVKGVFLGHFHVDKKKSFHGKKVYFNGSLVGTDAYALSKRLFGEPSQLLLVFDGKNVIDIPILLKD